MAIGEDPDELLEYAADGARRDVISKEQAAEQVAKDLERMSRERLLPRVEILEKVARYEAHLQRGLYKAMHELEAPSRLGDWVASLLWLVSIYRGWMSSKESALPPVREED